MDLSPNLETAVRDLHCGLLVTEVALCASAELRGYLGARRHTATESRQVKNLGELAGNMNLSADHGWAAAIAREAATCFPKESHYAQFLGVQADRREAAQRDLFPNAPPGDPATILKQAFLKNVGRLPRLGGAVRREVQESLETLVDETQRMWVPQISVKVPAALAVRVYSSVPRLGDIIRRRYPEGRMNLPLASLMSDLTRELHGEYGRLGKFPTLPRLEPAALAGVRALRTGPAPEASRTTVPLRRPATGAGAAPGRALERGPGTS